MTYRAVLPSQQQNFKHRHARIGHGFAVELSPAGDNRLGNVVGTPPPKITTSTESSAANGIARDTVYQFVSTNEAATVNLGRAVYCIEHDDGADFADIGISPWRILKHTGSRVLDGHIVCK